MYLIRTCTECGSTIEAPDLITAQIMTDVYDLACCDGITPEVSDIVFVNDYVCVPV